MNADTGYSPTLAPVQERRIEKAGAILDKLDICRRLIEMRPIDPKLALCRQLLGCVADDIAELAGADDERERRDRETIAKAAAPLPVKRRTFWQKLDAVAFVGIVGLACLLAAGWIGASVAIRAGWL